MIFFELSEHYHSREEFIAVGILYKYPARKKIYIKTRKREEQGNELTDVDVAVSRSIFITETGNKNRKKKSYPLIFYV